MGAEPAEGLDEDTLALDPMEEGIEPPERWAEADKFGVTAGEQRRGETLDQRLAQEEPDTTEERVGDEVYQPEEARAREYAERVGTSADMSGGSVAESLREPGEAERVQRDTS
ncbi:hypothetical protein NVS88_04235 [Corynebacteriales bacterium D3-21]|uniref:DUF5709 domain-containing protein n=2 Tax=Speluncibacter jeojiensis TaxID=2710754 RepID=A0A9X4LX05_9ACTN|nr:hypothetical protein [Corynebacteriales bacterium D3-21]